MASTVSQWLQPAGNWFETIVSALVILVALAFLAFIFERTGTGHFGSHHLTLRMPSAAGLNIGKDVRVGSMKIGTVTRLSLDGRDYSAIVEVAVRDDLSLPAESTARVIATPLGDVYLTINTGHAARIIPPGGVLIAVPTRPSAPIAGT